MVLKDLTIGHSVTAKERFRFLSSCLEKLEEKERVIFVGDTFYIYDIDIDSIDNFMEILRSYSSHEIFIQDNETVKRGRLFEDSWYRIPNWMPNIRVVTDISRILNEKELSRAITFDSHSKINKPKVETSKKIDSNVTVNISKAFYLMHKEDIIGYFINNIKNEHYGKEKSERLTKLGLEVLLGR